MLSKNKLKFIQSMERKKVRDEYNMFVAEGNKLVDEALSSGFPIELLVCTEEYFSGKNFDPTAIKEWIITDKESVKKASQLQAPQDALVVMGQFEPSKEQTDINNQLVLVLDCIQDPGNLGTILRIADWFGIQTVVCSPDTADVYNPKVVQASMGAIFRVKVVYTELSGFIMKAKQNGSPVYGTFLEGKNIYEHVLTTSGLIVMGNEGNGISAEIEQLVTDKLYIPSFAQNDAGSESLNVAVATAICCSEFRRRVDKF